MMMISSRREEDGRVSVRRRDFKSEYVSIEREWAIEIRDGEMHVSDRGEWWEFHRSNYRNIKLNSK